MSDLQKLENISNRNGDIKAFPLTTNLKSGNTGKDGWGELKIAVDNATVINFTNNKVIGVLYVIGREEWEKEGDSD